jgi:hypothetical protein
LKTGRRSKYPTLIDFITKILPNAKMVRFWIYLIFKTICFE